MVKLTREELLKRVEYSSSDKHGKVFIPNNIFELLVNEEELTKKGKRTSTHVDVAYTYLYYVTWLYRNAKYGVMTDENTSVGAIKEMIGFTANEKRINYIIKDGGVLDKLGLTKTVPFKEAPISYSYNDDVIDFVYADSLNDKNWSNRKTIKYPKFALESEEGEYGYGTFHGSLDGDNIANTHHVDFEVFVACMTNKNLGASAFYIYSFLKHKCDVAGGSIEIGLATIQQQTGLTEKKMRNALDGLRKHGLVTCYPAPFIVGAEEGEGANIYICNGADEYTEEEQKYLKRQLMFAEKNEKVKI